MIDEMEGGQVFFDPNCYSPTDCIAAVVGGVGNSRSSKTSFLVVVLSFLIFLFCCCPSIASISLVCVCAPCATFCLLSVGFLSFRFSCCRSIVISFGRFFSSFRFLSFRHQHSKAQQSAAQKNEVNTRKKIAEK